MRVLPNGVWSDGRSIDVLVYPGGQGTRRQLGEERFRTWLGDLRADGVVITRGRFQSPVRAGGDGESACRAGQRRRQFRDLRFRSKNRSSTG
ncbi:hypothetical protein BH18ACT4_BH18ACT4_02380 [soil metagenome]